jgi:hypothetical protein
MQGLREILQLCCRIAGWCLPLEDIANGFFLQKVLQQATLAHTFTARKQKKTGPAMPALLIESCQRSQLVTTL